MLKNRRKMAFLLEKWAIFPKILQKSRKSPKIPTFWRQKPRKTPFLPLKTQVFWPDRFLSSDPLKMAFFGGFSPIFADFRLFLEAKLDFSPFLEDFRLFSTFSHKNAVLEWPLENDEKPRFLTKKWDFSSQKWDFSPRFRANEFIIMSTKIQNFS